MSFLFKFSTCESTSFLFNSLQQKKQRKLLYSCWWEETGSSTQICSLVLVQIHNRRNREKLTCLHWWRNRPLHSGPECQSCSNFEQKKQKQREVPALSLSCWVAAFNTTVPFLFKVRARVLPPSCCQHTMAFLFVHG